MKKCEKCQAPLALDYSEEWRFCEKCRGVSLGSEDFRNNETIETKRTAKEAIMEPKDYLLFIMLPTIIIQFAINTNKNIYALIGAVIGAFLMTSLMTLISKAIIKKAVKNITETTRKLFIIVLAFVIYYGLFFILGALGALL
ncbi:MAG: hypothetical protein FWG36_11065 [Oscillospiraceae bacterium]|nr:hypothetical protein [Oscillospiraceae bacterium]